MAAQIDRGVPVSTLCPKFLHSNSTSHTWPFSAIAELIDNAYDPDASAKQFWIDKTVVKGEECLSFRDNGNGLDHETMHKMLSFGYSDKIAVKGLEPIGIYGNGFKSGSMRLGKDAIVFSKSQRTSCVGMLSQTYLEKIEAKQIIVPIVCFEEKKENKFSVKEEHKASLQDILRYSPFTTQEELLTEVNAISLPGSQGKTGTHIIIWNLRRTSTGSMEFDFETDRYDIRIPSEVYETMNDNPQPSDRVTSYVPESMYSLRAYCSILYLKPRMQIIVRGQKVKSQLIAKSLAFIRRDHYRPNFLTKRIPITFGYNTKSKDQYGIMMYHKNRLIRAYERVGCQLKANNKGVGVIGVIQCNFLDPTHNKQSFMETDKYRKTMNSLGVKLEEYYNEIRYRQKNEDPNSTIPVEDTMKRPDQNWAQCDDCLKWRKLPDGIDVSKLPDKWFCHMNPNPQFRSCQVEEEREDSDDDQPSYRKTYKQQEREDRRKEERQKTVHLPSAPTTPSRPLQGGAVRAESSFISQAACSPSSNGGFPVISNVRSLSVPPLRRKTTQPVTPQRPQKRPRVNGFHNSTIDALSSDAHHQDVNPQSSPSVSVVSDDDDTDDDLFILETGSTPKPIKPVFNPRNVKKEKEPTDANVGLLLECSDDAAVDDTSETNAAGSAAIGTSPSPAPPLELASITTQTEVPKVKKEEESQNKTDGEERAMQSACDKSSTERSSDLDAGSVEQRDIKQESSGDTQNENHEARQNAMTNDLESDENAGPSCADTCENRYVPFHHPSVGEVQKQQDQLLALMQDTAQERDSLKEQVNHLICQLQEMEGRLQELSKINVKKECSHQASQTEGTKGEKDYKSLFEKAKHKVNQLIKDKEALMAATEASLSAAQSDERDVDDIALQVDCLVRELDQANKEKEELRAQMDSLKEEKGNLVAQCEELKLSLQQQRENSAHPQTTSDSSVPKHPEAGGLADSRAQSSSDTSRSLIELRQNVGRLLITYVPVLDLSQVDFECNVIDEILEQVLSNMESDTAMGQRLSSEDD